MNDVFSHVAVGQHTTVFYRPTPTGREGFVVDELALVQSLKRRVLEERGLSELVDVTSAQSNLAEPGFHSHQFAAPFQGVTAELRLTPLELPWFEQALIPLALSVAVFLALVLWSLYRVVKTQLEFAQRQGNFVSAVSHELRTPLTAIRMHSEMLEAGLVDSPDKARQYYSTITAQTERLSRLIENVLLFSRLERKTEATSRQDVVDVVKKAASTLKPYVEKTGFSLELELPTVALARLNRDHVEQILFNLVENALKYAAGAEDRRLTLAVDNGPAEVTISLRDRGPGVPSELMQKIFEPFFRAEDEMTREHQGSGLGLALVQQLAHHMGATVSAEPARPGLRVILCLPHKA